MRWVAAHSPEKFRLRFILAGVFATEYYKQKKERQHPLYQTSSGSYGVVPTGVAHVVEKPKHAKHGRFSKVSGCVRLAGWRGSACLRLWLHRSLRLAETIGRLACQLACRGRSSCATMMVPCKCTLLSSTHAMDSSRDHVALSGLYSLGFHAEPYDFSLPSLRKGCSRVDVPKEYAGGRRPRLGLAELAACPGRTTYSRAAPSGGAANLDAVDAPVERMERPERWGGARPTEDCEYRSEVVLGGCGAWRERRSGTRTVVSCAR